MSCYDYLTRHCNLEHGTPSMTRIGLFLLSSVILLLLPACALSADSGRQASPTPDLAIRDEQGLYHHPEIPWEGSVQDVESILGKTLELHRQTKAMITNPITLEVTGDYTQLERVIFVCEDAMTWDGCNAWARFEFKDGGDSLWVVGYYFEHPEDDLSVLYDSLNARLLEQFGDPDVTNNHEVYWKVAESPPDTVITRIEGSSWGCRVADDQTIVGVHKCINAEDRVVQVVLGYQIDDMTGR